MYWVTIYPFFFYICTRMNSMIDMKCTIVEIVRYKNKIHNFHAWGVEALI